jgi:hypothetical protein
VRTQVATDAGSSTKPSEDRALLGSNLLVVLDGLTARTDTGCIHGVAWYADRLAAALMQFSHLSPKEALKSAISYTTSLHADTCDITHPATPCAAVGIVQLMDDQVRYLVLGDVTVLIDSTDGKSVISDQRISSTAREERAAADALPSGSPAKADALVRMKRAELAARNTAEGYWIAAADPTVADRALIGEVPLSRVRRVAILTDGAARAVDMFGLLDWSGALDLLGTDGPDELIRRVREAEASDPSATQWPRNKVSDDATAVYLER